MLLPDQDSKQGIRDRHALFRNTIRECEVSRNDRQMRALYYRNWYLLGSEDGVRARYNKLWEHVQSSASYLYSPASVRFNVSLPPHYADRYDAHLPIVKDEWASVWADYKAALTFGAGVEWAHPMDTVIFKPVLSNGQAHLSLISDPSDVGVWDESVDSWRDQEAITHWYTVSLPVFRRLIALHPEREHLWRVAQDQARPGREATAMSPLMERILTISSTSPNLTGTVNALGEGTLGRPQVQVPVVDLAELWIRDDDAKDYRVVTNFLATETIILDRANPLLPGGHPFFPLTLNPVPGYAWGLCPLQYLVQLQGWLTTKYDQLDLRDELQVNPPILFIGMSLLDGEKSKSFRKPGGDLHATMPNADAKPIVPPPLADPFGFPDQIHAMWSRIGGLPKGTIGAGVDAVARSGDQAIAEAILSAGPTLSKAVIVEKVLSEVSTALLRLHRRAMIEPLTSEKDELFLLSQIPPELAVRVWGHSASPIYQEQMVMKAELALKNGAIDKVEYLELLGLPGMDVLRRSVRKLSEAQAAYAKREQEIREAKALGAGRR